MPRQRRCSNLAVDAKAAVQANDGRIMSGLLLRVLSAGRAIEYPVRRTNAHRSDLKNRLFHDKFADCDEA